MMDAREHIRKSVCETDKKLLADSLLNRATTQLTAWCEYTSIFTSKRKLNQDRGQLDRCTNETQAQWAKKMQNEAMEAEQRMKKFNELQEQYDKTKTPLPQ